MEKFKKNRKPEKKLEKVRGSDERNLSYVKKFLLCKNCGIKIPKKGQMEGKVPCPYCGRQMVEAI